MCSVWASTQGFGTYVIGEHPIKAQISLSICTVSPEPLLSMEIKESLDQKLDLLAPLGFGAYTISSGNLEIFVRVLFSRNFMKIKSSQIGEIPLSFSDIGKSRLCCEFVMSKICVIKLFAKIKFSRKFPNLQYQKLVSLPWCTIRKGQGMNYCPNHVFVFVLYIKKKEVRVVIDVMITVLFMI